MLGNPPGGDNLFRVSQAKAKAVLLVDIPYVTQPPATGSHPLEGASLQRGVGRRDGALCVSVDLRCALQGSRCEGTDTMCLLEGVKEGSGGLGVTR